MSTGPLARTAMRALAYEVDGEAFDGAIVAPEGAAHPLPGVLVVPAWEGRSPAQEDFATKLARRGYAAFCVDVYGSGKRGSTPVDCEDLMTPLLADRARLRARLLRAVEVARSCTEIDAERIAAVGFCFGGLCVLDLARAHAPLAAVASFHGLLTPLPAELVPTRRIDTRILLLHGWDDPLATPAHVTAICDELTTAKADWQLQIYGGTMHAFTNPYAQSPGAGIQYHPRSAARAWATLEWFLDDTLAESVPCLQ